MVQAHYDFELLYPNSVVGRNWKHPTLHHLVIFVCFQFAITSSNTRNQQNTPSISLSLADWGHDTLLHHNVHGALNRALQLTAFGLD